MYPLLAVPSRLQQDTGALLVKTLQLMTIGTALMDQVTSSAEDFRPFQYPVLAGVEVDVLSSIQSWPASKSTSFPVSSPGRRRSLRPFVEDLASQHRPSPGGEFFSFPVEFPHMPGNWREYKNILHFQDHIPGLDIDPRPPDTHFQDRLEQRRPQTPASTRTTTTTT
ncbi:uncharacterized protein [Panulirus ornatus]|uniref:uncharacterized protein n=1 Tax=Panulirus ornatus TaxID=150431 RepID=UPI003A8704DF